MIGIGDPVASVGRLAFSITDRRNSSLRSSDTTGRAFRKSKTTLARAPMVSNPDHLRLTLSLNCRPVLIWEITFYLEIIRTVWLPATANFRLYFLCRLALPLDGGFYPVETERVWYAGDREDLVIFMTKSESGWMQVSWSYGLNIESWDGNIVQQKLIFVIWKLILHDRNWKYNF